MFSPRQQQGCLRSVDCTRMFLVAKDVPTRFFVLLIENSVWLGEAAKSSNKDPSHHLSDEKSGLQKRYRAVRSYTSYKYWRFSSVMIHNGRSQSVNENNKKPCAQNNHTQCRYDPSVPPIYSPTTLVYCGHPLQSMAAAERRQLGRTPITAFGAMSHDGKTVDNSGPPFLAFVKRGVNSKANFFHF